MGGFVLVGFCCRGVVIVGFCLEAVLSWTPMTDSVDCGVCELCTSLVHNMWFSCLFIQKTFCIILLCISDTAKIFSKPKLMVFKKDLSVVLVWDSSSSLYLGRMH